MTNTEDITEVLDGRQARRQRNIDAVLDVVLEMFAEESMFPTIEQAATRSGLSLRSLYRYFAISPFSRRFFRWLLRFFDHSGCSNSCNNEITICNCWFHIIWQFNR